MAKTTTRVPRPEYPRPQFVRERWLNLNGPWEFEIDAGDSGFERGLLGRKLKDRITVPFCPESESSGIGNVDFLNAVWYRRRVKIPADWTRKRVLFHVQACDYDTTVWVNGQEVCRHRGGFTPITCDLGGIARAGKEIEIVIRARDDHRELKPLGKQCWEYANMGCHYIRTTGIWQTVWLEPVPKSYLQRPRITPSVGESCFHIVQPIVGPCDGLSVRVRLLDGRRVISERIVGAVGDFSPQLTLEIPAQERRLWSPEDPFLYGLKVELIDQKGRIVDQAASYAGLRSITIDGKAIRLNGESIFHRLVLDQGYYPDGILTAPTDKALVEDIKLSMEAGFNGARLHQKVFEERFLYHCDRLGYLVWGEFADWGCNARGPEFSNQKPTSTYITQWLEVLNRDYNHPAIIGWCPLNETWQSMNDKITALDDVTWGMYLATKAMDQTRPVVDSSGYSHRVPETDVYDSHDYTQDPKKLADQHAGLKDGKPFCNAGPDGKAWSIPYRGQPYFVSEFGGIWWNPKAKKGDPSWGYGDRPKSIEEFYRRFAGQCRVLLDDPNMFGYCYTQLTDVYQEQNGIYTFDRNRKFDMSRIRRAQQRRAAIEKE